MLAKGFSVDTIRTGLQEGFQVVAKIVAGETDNQTGVTELTKGGGG